MKVSELTRVEKIDLIKKLSAGEVSVINGQIIELTNIILYSGKNHNEAEKYFVKDQELTPEDFSKILSLYPEGKTIIFLPTNGREMSNEDIED